MSKSTSHKELILIRHGTTEMNELLASDTHKWGADNFVDAMLFDTRLSKRGISEAKDLNNRIKRRDASVGDLARAELLVSSPLTRALQTATYAFAGSVVSESVPRIVLPLATERLFMSSEIGRSRVELETEFPHWDFSLVKDSPPWWYTHPLDEPYVEWRPAGEYAAPGEPRDAFAGRMRSLRAWLEQREETVIVLVCHWGVARALCGLELANCEAKSVLVHDLLKEPLVDL